MSKAKGYNKVKWRESSVYTCSSCGKTNESEAVIKAHVADVHGIGSAEPTEEGEE